MPTINVTLDGLPVMFTKVDDPKKTNPTAYRLSVKSDTPFILSVEKSLFYKERDADDYAAELLNGAKQRDSKKFVVTITRLYKDRDSGRILPGYQIPDRILQLRG